MVEPMARTAVVALVVTCNRPEKLAIALERCLQEGFDRIWVVNNGAWIDPAPWRSRVDGDRLAWLQLSDNLGGAGGFERGLAQVYGACREGRLPWHSWCVLLDDDAYPAPGCLDRFRSRLDGYGCFGAVAAAVLDPQGRAAEVNRPILNVFRRPGRLRTVLRGGLQGPWPRQVRDWYHVPSRLIEQPGHGCAVDAISFVGLFLNLQEMQRLGCPLPDPRLFIYSDDTLFTWGLRRSGAALWLDSDLRFVHDTATGYADGLVRPIWKLFFLTRNSWAVYRSLTGPLLGPLLFGLGLLSKWLTCGRYPTAGERQAARLVIGLALEDVWHGRRSRPLAELPQG